MSTPTVPFEQLADLARRGQEATVVAVRGATEAVRTYAEAVVPTGSGPVDPQVATAVAFDLAEQLLRVQREYASTAAALLSEAGSTVTAQATAAGEAVKARTEQAAERVVDLATEATRRAADSARNGVAV